MSMRSWGFLMIFYIGTGGVLALMMHRLVAELVITELYDTVWCHKNIKIWLMCRMKNTNLQLPFDYKGVVS